MIGIGRLTWLPTPSITSQVEVCFIAEGSERTRVELVGAVLAAVPLRTPANVSQAPSDDPAESREWIAA